MFKQTFFKTDKAIIKNHEIPCEFAERENFIIYAAAALAFHECYV